MKLKLSVAVIVAASLSIMVAIFFTVEKISRIPRALTVSKAEQIKNVLLLSHDPSKAHLCLSSLSLSNAKNGAEDEKIIMEVVDLSEEELGGELISLRKRMEQEKLFGKLELRKMDPQKAAEAKAILERFTLLSIEQTRRKYLPIEPELKDALYAHRDSLKDIRGLLARY